MYFPPVYYTCALPSESAGPSAPPEPPSSPLPTLSKRVVLKGKGFILNLTLADMRTAPLGPDRPSTTHR